MQWGGGGCFSLNFVYIYMSGLWNPALLVGYAVLHASDAVDQMLDLFLLTINRGPQEAGSLRLVERLYESSGCWEDVASSPSLTFVAIP